jgi:prolyl-tRNA synthetase
LADIAQAQVGYLCPRCDGILTAESAIELAHCFKLGTRYSTPVGVTYLDADECEHPVVMGSYGIGVGRLLAAVIETHHDEYGIVWPPALAPYDVYLLNLGIDEDVVAQADAAYEHLSAAGLDVLYDDRNVSPGVKFNDADMIGCPVRVTVSKRSVAKGGYELKARWDKKRCTIPRERLLDQVQRLLASFNEEALAVPSTSSTMRA